MIEGSPIYLNSKKYNDEIKRRYPEDPYAILKQMSPLYGKTDKESVAKLKELREKSTIMLDKHKAASLAAEEWFINNNLNSYYSAVLILERNSGKLCSHISFKLIPGGSFF